MLIIAEKINSSRKSIAKAIENEDSTFIQKIAKEQEEAGADYIDVNAGSFVDDEKEKLVWIMQSVQQVTDLPLCIDSANSKTIEAVFSYAAKTPMINSISLEAARLERTLSLAVENGCNIIALCQSEEKLADTTDEKVRMAEEIVDKVYAAGLPLDNLYIDPLVQPLATNKMNAVETLNAIHLIMTKFPGVHTTCGLTNISYGLPERKLINRTFLVAAIMSGLDSAIIDPTDQQLYGALKAAIMVAGKDDYCREYVSAFREGKL